MPESFSFSSTATSVGEFAFLELSSNKYILNWPNFKSRDTTMFLRAGSQNF